MSAPGQIAALPKVLLHDHLDGGLRPATVLELAGEIGYELPASEPAALADWFVTAASAGSLEQYIATFSHTLAVMQTVGNLHRVAREAAIDLATDGVVYAEQRYAPELHQRHGLSLQQVVDAVQEGFEEGIAEAELHGHTIRIGTIVTAMRTADRSDELAALAVANRDNGVVGFDIAGAEAGFLPSRHASAFRTLRDASFPTTVHAGEAGGLESIAEAVHIAGAQRLGHGVRIMDDVQLLDAGTPGVQARGRFGVLAHWVRDRRIPLEVCPSSNVQTGAAASIARHPATLLKRLGFAVTINTDNRLQSGTSLTRELTLLVEQADWSLADLCDVTVTAAQHAFLHQDEREDLIDRVILPAFATDTIGRHRA